jgi:hypothetical protein
MSQSGRALLCLLLGLALGRVLHADAIGIEAEIGYLNLQNNTLVIVRDDLIEELSIDTALAKGANKIEVDQTQSLTHDAVLIMPDDSGGYWVIGKSNVSRWHPEEGLCTVEKPLNQIATLGRRNISDTLLISDEFYLDGTGVLGQNYNIDTQCKATAEAATQPFVTAVVIDSTEKPSAEFRALSSLIVAGPETKQPPYIEHWQANNKIHEFPVMTQKEDPPYKVIDMMIAADRLLLLGDNGLWELWDVAGTDRILSGNSGSQTAGIVPLSEAGSIAVIGDSLIDMQNASAVNLGMDGELLAIDQDSGNVLLRRDNHLIIDQKL